MTTPRTHSSQAYWFRNDSNAIEAARNSAPGPGMAKRHTRFCVRCVADRDPTGGREVNGLWLCALHPRKPAA